MRYKLRYIKRLWASITASATGTMPPDTRILDCLLPPMRSRTCPSSGQRLAAPPPCVAPLLRRFFASRAAPLQPELSLLLLLQRQSDAGQIGDRGLDHDAGSPLLSMRRAMGVPRDGTIGGRCLTGVDMLFSMSVSAADSAGLRPCCRQGWPLARRCYVGLPVARGGAGELGEGAGGWAAR